MPPLTEEEKERRRRERQMQQQTEVPAAKSPITPGETLKPREQTGFQKAMALPREAEQRAGVTILPAKPTTPGFEDVGAKLGRAISPERRVFREDRKTLKPGAQEQQRGLQPFVRPKEPTVRPTVTTEARQTLGPLEAPVRPGQAAPALTQEPVQPAKAGEKPEGVSERGSGPIWIQGNLAIVPGVGAFSTETGEKLTGRTVTRGPSGEAETLFFGDRAVQQPGSLTEAQKIRADVLQKQQSDLVKAAGEAIQPEQRDILLQRADDVGKKLEEIISPPTPAPRGETVKAPIPPQERRAAVVSTPEDKSKLTEIGEAFRKGDVSIAKKYFGQETPESIRLFRSLPFKQRQFILENR